ncbi:MAG: type II toxin-antitoxin system HipA family toxin [Bdellovibrio sp.]|nr:type II toxin-antitoxin system HipA family toxin [Bdellovibrio sp.]
MNLYVYFENQKVGTLVRNTDLVYSFSYTESWQNSKNSFPLSLAMPLTQKKFQNKITLSFFENLLPEGDLRKTLENDHHIKGTFEFLENFGQDCAGAFVVTKDENFFVRQSSQGLVEVPLSTIYEAINKKKPVADVIAAMDPGYLSLAGAQDKFPAIYKKGRFYLPQGGGATTHIIKTPIQRKGIKESVYNEYYCMQLAREVGFKIPKCQILDGPHPLFIIERYDRSSEKRIVSRIHQQDFCQAQGITSEFKYEAKGGPSIQRNYELILNSVAAKKRLPNAEDFLDWICFNLLIGNNDSHSKNISLLFHDGKNELAPFYDLISTAIYPSLKKDFAFAIGQRTDFSKIGLKQFKLLENQLQMKPGTFHQRINAVIKRVENKKDNLADRIESEFSQARIAKRISDLIERRIKGLRQQGV